MRITMDDLTKKASLEESRLVSIAAAWKILSEHPLHPCGLCSEAKNTLIVCGEVRTPEPVVRADGVRIYGGLLQAER
jgi:hypothetical protein